MAVDVDSLPDEARETLVLFPEFQISGFNETGANGYVMIGRHGVLRKEVAIKIYFHDQGEVDQEPAIIASINHENVLKVYDARKVNEYCSYYMMPSANDGDLFSFMDNYNISLTLAHRLLCQLLSGLAALHCKNNKLVHRDLKPENLLVHDDTIVIADFGSVRKINEVTNHAPASKHSILYRPPEAFGNNGFFDCSSDVYQAGMIGYLLFGGDLSNDLLLQLNKGDLVKLESLEKAGDGYETAVFIDSCIEKRIKAGKIVDWKSLPVYVPSNVKRTLRAAVSSHGKRYRNVSEFLLELARIRPTIPDWMDRNGEFFLENWNGNDYLLYEKDGKPVLKKKKRGSKAFRIDNSVTGSTLTEAYGQLKSNIGLP